MFCNDYKRGEDGYCINYIGDKSEVESCLSKCKIQNCTPEHKNTKKSEQKSFTLIKDTHSNRPHVLKDQNSTVCGEYLLVDHEYETKRVKSLKGTNCCIACAAKVEPDAFSIDSKDYLIKYNLA